MNLFRGLNKLVGKKEGKLEKGWEFPVEEAILAPPTADNLNKNEKAIIFGTKEGNVYAIDENAKIKWVYKAGGKIDKVKKLFLDETAISIICSPVIADINNDEKNEVIVGSERGILHVLNNNGKMLWQYKSQDAIRSVLAADINNDKKLEIMFGSRDGYFYALSGKKLLWKFKADSGIEAGSAILKSKNKLQIIFGSNNGEIYSLNNKGKLIWKFKTDGKITAEPVIGNIYGGGEDYIIIGSHDNNLYVLDDKGKLKWKYETEGSIYSKASLIDVNKDKRQEIIFGSCDDNIYLLSCNGNKIWSYETDFWVVASPIAIDLNDDNHLEIIAGSYDQSLYILDAEGSFQLNYMPGISGITQQTGSYSDIYSAEPAYIHGKPIWQCKTKGMIISVACLKNKEKNIIIGTENSLNSLYLNKK